MNIAFFLLPKKDVVFMPLQSTMRQALERMEYHKHSAVPLIDSEGRYAGTITEGDLLWELKSIPSLTLEGTEKVLLKDIPMRTQNTPIHIGAEMEDLLTLAIDQNFVPVVDDDERFIGIIRRKTIIEYCAKLVLENNKERQEAI